MLVPSFRHPVRPQALAARLNTHGIGEVVMGLS